MFGEIWQFIVAVLHYWADWSTGGLLVMSIAIWRLLRDKDFRKKTGIAMFSFFLFLGLFSAWEDQKQKKESSESDALTYKSRAEYNQKRIDRILDDRLNSKNELPNLKQTAAILSQELFEILGEYNANPTAPDGQSLYLKYESSYRNSIDDVQRRFGELGIRSQSLEESKTQIRSIPGDAGYFLCVACLSNIASVLKTWGASGMENAQATPARTAALHCADQLEYWVKTWPTDQIQLGLQWQVFQNKYWPLMADVQRELFQHGCRTEQLEAAVTGLYQGAPMFYSPETTNAVIKVANEIRRLAEPLKE
jgi:hypothetical protein